MNEVNNQTDAFEELAVTIAHEIKNPLSLALANIYLIKMEDRENSFSRYSGAIEKELHRINQLVIDFLQAAKEAPEEERIELNSLLDEVAEGFREALTLPVKITTNRYIKPLYVRGDAKRLGIVFNNLIKNAIEAIEEEGEIDISLRESGDRIYVGVCDNGQGLPDANEGSHKIGGSGVGLSICRQIVAKHGGKLSVENNEEAGVTALVELPKII